MGTFRVNVEIGDSTGERYTIVSALVDTGASYSWVPASVLRELGLEPSFSLYFVTADGRRIERQATETRFRLEGIVRTSIVVFGDEGTVPLLGAHTLGSFGLAPDPVNQRLIAVDAFLL